MKSAVYPGSFDPTTFGHFDIIKRASSMVDRLVVGVLDNPSKKPMFSSQERVAQLKAVTAVFPNVEVSSFSGLLVDFARQNGVKIIIRGLRAVMDFEYEFQMALTNRNMCSDIETVFIPTSMQYLYLNSSIVKEVARFGGNVDDMVPPYIKECLFNKINNQ